jgi:hypothetical protein
MSKTNMSHRSEAVYIDDERTCTGKIASFVRALSIGKYNHGLYLKGESHQSSIVGGVLTTVCAVVLIVYMVFVFKDIIDCAEYSMDESVLDITEDDYGLLNLKISEFLTTTMRVGGV